MRAGSRAGGRAGPGAARRTARARALGRGALLGEPLDRLGADAVDVVEDRAGQAIERARLVAGSLAGGEEALPGQAGPDAVGAQQRVEAAAGAHLAAAERDVDLARAAVVLVRTLDRVHEARQRALDADPKGAAERALERTRVGRDLAPDGHDDVLREIGQRRAQRLGQLGRQIRGHLLARGYRSRARTRTSASRNALIL